MAVNSGARISSVSKRWSGSSTHWPAGHADVVDAHHREAAPQRLARAEQHDARHRGPEPAVVPPGTTQGAQQVVVRPAQLFGVRVDGAALLPVVGDGGGVDVGHVGIGQHGGIEGIHLMPGVERDQIVFRALLVGRAHAAERAPWQAQLPEEDRLFCRRGLRHMDHHHGPALQLFYCHARADRLVESAGALAGQVRLQLVRVADAIHPVGRVKQILRIAVHAQQQIATAKAGLVGKGADRLQDGAVDAPRLLGLDAVRLIERGQLLQQVFGAAHHAGTTSTSIWPESRRGSSRSRVRRRVSVLLVRVSASSAIGATKLA